MTNLRPQVAIARSFFSAFSDLPKRAQKKTREFLEKFQNDPTSSGIQYKKPEGAADPKVRSVRIDQSYRAIVIQPPKGDIYLVVWVDNHDDAYDWARNRRFEVNPLTGTFQVFSAETGTQLATESQDEPPSVEAQAEPTVEPQRDGPDAAGTTRLFAGIDDEQILLAGVPQPLLPAVRAVSDSGLDALKPALPEEAYEVLIRLALGMSLFDAIADVDLPSEEPKSVDTEDFAKALEQPHSKRQFAIFDDEHALQEALDRPLEQWRTFLHPSQRKLVERRFNGPARVLGGAGTGKTVVLMHRARHLVRSVYTGPGDRVLVTTFTRNLAGDIESSLRSMCEAEFDRLEITSLHSFVARYLRQHGIERRFPEGRERRQLMAEARDTVELPELSDEFFLEEFDRVVLPQEVVDRDGYFKARRVGRGVRLGRKQRAEIWTVFERYRELLAESEKVERQDAVREARMLVEQNGRRPFRSVVADEAQDLTAIELRLLRALVEPSADDLFLVGDGHQRIYGQATPLSHCGIEIRGRSKRLKLNYRTTDAIARQGLAVLAGSRVDDLDDGIDTLDGYTSLRPGAPPVVETFPDERSEADFVLRTVKKWLDEGEHPSSICIAARTGKALEQRYGPILSEEGIAWTRVERDSDLGEGIRLATMHRMKGLEFARVLLTSVHDGMVPLPLTTTTDPTVIGAHRLQEQCLLYVACTRARDRLVICGYGSPSPLLGSRRIEPLPDRRSGQIE